MSLRVRTIRVVDSNPVNVGESDVGQGIVCSILSIHSLLSLSLSTLVVWCVMSCHAMPCGVSCHVVSWNGRATGHHHILASEECCWLNRRPLGRERKTDIGHIDEPGFDTLYFYVDRATWSFNIPSFNHRYMGFWFKVSSEINLVISP